MNKKISGFEAFCILLMFSINGFLLNAPKIIIKQCSTGAFLNSIIIGVLGLILLIMLIKVLKYFPSSDILDISNYLGGKILKFIVAILFLIIITILICLYIAQFVVLLKTVYFHNSPLIFILLFFILGILICNLNGFSAVKKSICFYFPISILTLIILVTYNLSDFSILKITPLFGNSFESTIISGSSNIFIFTNFIILYFFLPFLDNNKNLQKISILSFVISWIFLVLLVANILSFYPFYNSIFDINPIYTLTRRIELSNFLQRIDGLFVTIAMFSCLSYISFLFYLITLILKKLLKAENEKMLAYPIISFLIGITYLMINNNYYKSNGTGLYQKIYNITIYCISLLIVFISAIKKKLTTSS